MPRTKKSTRSTAAAAALARRIVRLEGALLTLRVTLPPGTEEIVASVERVLLGGEAQTLAVADLEDRLDFAATLECDVGTEAIMSPAAGAMASFAELFPMYRCDLRAWELALGTIRGGRSKWPAIAKLARALRVHSVVVDPENLRRSVARVRTRNQAR